MKDVFESKRVRRLVRARAQQCYRNAFQVILHVPEYEDAEYVEGMAVESHGLALEHGWVEKDGTIIDPTLPANELAYFPGLRFKGLRGLARSAFQSQEGPTTFLSSIASAGVASKVPRIGRHWSQPTASMALRIWLGDTRITCPAASDCPPDGSRCHAFFVAVIFRPRRPSPAWARMLAAWLPLRPGRFPGPGTAVSACGFPSFRSGAARCTVLRSRTAGARSCTNTTWQLRRPNSRSPARS